MKLIYSQPFTKVLRKIDGKQQHYIEQHEMIHLYEDRIVAETKLYYLKDVHDVSYKSLSNQYWFLYLHTNQGLISFTVKTTPNQFVKEFKKIK